MVLKFIFLRHGEAQHNVDFHKVGEAAFTDPKNKDAPLTEVGKQQAQDVAKKLSAYLLLDIWSSPLTRCVETSLELFEELNVGELYLHDSLLERLGGGHVCNDRKSKIELKDIVFSTKFLPEYGPPWVERENQTSLHHRMKAFVLWLAYLYKDIEEGHLLIVSHNDAISALTYTSLKNCEYVILSLEEILNAKP